MCNLGIRRQKYKMVRSGRMRKRLIRTIAVWRIGDNGFDGEKWRRTWWNHGHNLACNCDEGTVDWWGDGWHEKNEEEDEGMAEILHTNVFFGVLLFKVSCFSKTATMFQAVLSLVKALFDPNGEQEALGVVCQRLARFDGDSTWTDLGVMA